MLQSGKKKIENVSIRILLKIEYLCYVSRSLEFNASLVFIWGVDCFSAIYWAPGLYLMPSLYLRPASIWGTAVESISQTNLRLNGFPSPLWSAMNNNGSLCSISDPHQFPVIHLQQNQHQQPQCKPDTGETVNDITAIYALKQVNTTLTF